MLRLYRNHSALLDSLHTRTQPYTTTYQPYCTHRDLTRRSLLIRNFPYYLRLYLRIDYRLSTPSVFWALSLLPLCRIHLVNGLPTCRDCTLHVPRRLRKVRDSNSRSVLPLASLAVRCFRPLSQPSKYVYPDRSVLCFKPANLTAGWE